MMWWPSEKVVAELGVWLLDGETWSAVETPGGFRIDKSEQFSLEPDGTSWWRSDTFTSLSVVLSGTPMPAGYSTIPWPAAG